MPSYVSMFTCTVQDSQVYMDQWSLSSMQRDVFCMHQLVTTLGAERSNISCLPKFEEI